MTGEVYDAMAEAPRVSTVRRRVSTNCRLAVAVAVLLLGVAGCADAVVPVEPDAVDLELGFTQILPEEGTSRGLLRVINHEPEPITVTAVGLAWPGFGDVLDATDGDTVVPAASELMLRVELPEPECGGSGEAPSAVVVGRLTVDGEELSRPLTGAAQEYLRRLWRAQCDQELVQRSFRIRFEDDPEQVTGEAGDRVDTALVISRLDGHEPVRLTASGGSVLYDLRLTGRRAVPSRVDESRVPLAILPGNRCDEHAIGQATAPYDFSVTLRLDGRRIVWALRPPLAVQDAASVMLLRHCGTVRQ